MSAPAPRMAPFPPPGPMPPACAVHSARAACALCRSCGKPGCGECLTKADGVNRCASCLARAWPVRRLPPEMMRFLATRAIPRSRTRVLLAALTYAFVALAAAAWGIALPFFANEEQLSKNRERMADVQLALAAYVDDVGRYPARERGLVALLAASSADRDRWKGPYLTARAADGHAALVTADAGKVLDAFGRPVFYWTSPVDESDPDATPDTIYLASPGANGVWDTPGVTSGKAPHDSSGDDVVQWIAWP
jgi:type II secretory pathway pseudopilin PulG